MSTNNDAICMEPGQRVRLKHDHKTTGSIDRISRKGFWVRWDNSKTGLPMKSTFNIQLGYLEAIPTDLAAKGTEDRFMFNVCKWCAPDPCYGHSNDERNALEEGERKSKVLESIRIQRDRYKKALEDITKRGKGTGGAAVVTTETLRAIAKEALAI